MSANNESPVEAVVQSEVSEDKIKDTKTIYDVSGFEVFWRNFIAGIGRALGAVFVYIIFLSVMGYLFSTLVYPRLEPFITEYREALDSLNRFSNPSELKLDTPNLEDLLNQLNQDK